MRNLFFIISGFLFITSLHYAQLTVKDQESSPNTLMQVIDEGSAGSIFLPPVGSSLTGTKLYNYGNSLYWGSNKLGYAGSAGGWTDDGSTVYTTNSSDKVGIGISSPSASLHVSGNDGVLFVGTYGIGNIPIEGAGQRMMWYSKKAAFRAGFVQSFASTFWDADSIGPYSVAMGENTKAKGTASTAMGISTQAHGYASTSMGGLTVADGRYSAVFGWATNVESYNGFVIGRFNVGGGDPDVWVSTDPLFEIGNGDDFDSRANALTVLKNGNIGIGLETPAFKLQVHEKSSGHSYMSFSNETTGTSDGNGVLIGIDPNEDFRIHSYEDNNIKFYINNGEKVRISSNGNVGIGTNSPSGKLDVNGSIYQRGEELYSDYVFEDDYVLESIADHTEYMWREKHLPAIPKAKVDEEGREIVEVGLHRRGIVEELEKAHIYISQLEERISKLEQIIMNK